MPKPYPTPSINQSGDLFTHANKLTDGWAGVGMIITIFIVILLIMKAKFYKTSDSFATASLISFILGSMLWSMGVIQGNVVMVFLATAIASILWMVFDTK